MLAFWKTTETAVKETILLYGHEVFYYIVQSTQLIAIAVALESFNKKPQ